MMISFVGSMMAEVISLSLYYPFDLIKTRMQTNPVFYNYIGTFDAYLKILNENRA
jgi:hypothetical protein